MPDATPVSGDSDERAILDFNIGERARAKREERFAARKGLREEGEGKIRVTINPPHTVQCRGGSVAIRIEQAQGDPAGFDGVTLDDFVFYDSATDSLRITNIFTDGRDDVFP